FAYRANRSVDNAINLALHHFSSAFNTIVPELLVEKLVERNISTSICQWISSFLSNWKQHVKVGNLLSYPLFLSTGVPQGCVLSPLLFAIYTNECTSHCLSVKLLKFADDTTMVGLISNRDETTYREEVSHLMP
ncbi:hypothetical protein LDENG_00226140, partial [Lucifuga dentata]